MRQVVAAIVGMVLCLVMVGSLAAQEEPAAPQDQRGRAQWTDRLVERIKSELQLTDEQVQEIRQQWAVMAQKMQEAGNDREKRQAAWNDLQAGIRGLLTPEQQKRYDEAQQRLRQRAQDWAVFSSVTRVDAAVRGLNLDAQTRQRIEDLRQERDRQVKAALDAYTDRLMPLLTPAQQEEVKKSLAEPTRGGAGRPGATP